MRLLPAPLDVRLSLFTVLLCGGLVVSLSMGIRHGFGFWQLPMTQAHKTAATESILNVIDRYAPNFKRSILGLQVLSPWDLEQTLGLVNGDIFHGALQLNQLWAARPVLGYGNYRSPVRGLYLCGSGAHPGGGVTGLPGRNAAREILRDL